MNETPVIEVPALPIHKRRWFVPSLVGLLIFLCSCCCLLGAAGLWGDDLIAWFSRPVAINPVEVPYVDDTQPSEEGNGGNTGIQLYVDGKQVAASGSGVCALYYQTTIGVTADLKLIVPQGYSWALDADSIMQYGPINALDDVLFFGDEPGTYNIPDVSSGGLCVAQAGAAPDLAGPAILNRATAAKLYQWPRPTYYLTPNGQPKQVQVDPFGQ